MLFREHKYPTKHWSLFLPVLFIFFLLLGCRDSQDAHNKAGSFENGYIVYNLNWHGNGVESVLNTFFPSELKLYFSKPNMRMEMTTMGGVGRVVFLLNTKKGDGHVMVSVVGVRSHYHELIAKDNVSFLFNGERTHLMENETSDTLYMGTPCKYTTSYIGTDEENSYRLIYAPSIGWSQMNDYVPFNGIDGMVLCGSFCLGKITVEVEAKEIVPTEVDPRLFQVESGYKEISRSAMEQLLGFGFNK